MDPVIMTLCFVVQGDQVLLGFKKKKALGQGKWNGFGGKVQEGECIDTAAKREVLEESGVEVIDLKQVGIITYISDQRVHQVHIYIDTEYQNEPKETFEMKPQWFSVDDILGSKMELWDDMLLWFYLVLANRVFEGTVYYNDDNTKVLEYTLK